MNTKPQYADVNSYVGVNIKPVVLFDDDAVINSIVNVLLCPRRTRKFRPGYGSSLSYYLHRPVTSSNAVAIRDVLVMEINRWVPFVSLRTTDIKVTPLKGGYGYNLSISFTSILGKGKRTANLDLSVLG